MGTSTAQRGSKDSPSRYPGNGAGADPAVGLATLKAGALAAGRARDADSFLADAVRQLARLVGSELSSILLLEGRHLHHAAAVGLPADYLEAIDGLEIGPEAGSCGAAAAGAVTVVTPDIELDPRWEDYRELARSAGLRSCWSVPLKLPDGTVLGSFATYATEPHAPSEQQLELTEAYASIVALGLDNVRRQAEVAAGYESAVLALTTALDVRDDYTGAHSTATSRLVREVGRRLKLDAQELLTVAQVAALHDVGKIGVPIEILTSADPLTPEQTRMVRDHPVIGEQILRQIPGMERVADAVRHEHERWDGTGYPDGLAGEQIPLASRIVFACDAYHAMISDRPYRSALDQVAAVAELRANAGNQFDPRVVEALLGVLGDEAAILGCSPSEAADSRRREAIERVAAEIGAEDVFVFRKVAHDTYSHLAGAGRGDGWAGNIELGDADRQVLPGLREGRVECVAAREPTRIVGPYYARSAVIVPCRHDVIIVFGSSTESLRGASERDMRATAERVAQLVDHVPAAKRLADELEVLDAVRAVTMVDASGVEAALSEIAERAANALSCEFGGVVVDGGLGEPRIGCADLGWMPGGGAIEAAAALRELATTVREQGALLIQDTSVEDARAPRGFGAADGAAAVHAVPIDDVAVLVTVHARPSPRGFTSLCQRVASSLAGGAELVIRRVIAQEQLSHENARLELRASTDPLTGVNNRGGWDEALVRAQVELSRSESAFAVAIFDLDELKHVNDTRGHAAGDELLRSLARILDETARANDYVARIGGDEFAVLLRDCDTAGVAAWCRRLVDAVAAHNRSDPRFSIKVSYGYAAADAERGLAEALARADRSLYGYKLTEGRI